MGGYKKTLKKPAFKGKTWLDDMVEKNGEDFAYHIGNIRDLKLIRLLKDLALGNINIVAKRDIFMTQPLITATYQYCMEQYWRTSQITDGLNARLIYANNGIAQISSDEYNRLLQMHEEYMSLATTYGYIAQALNLTILNNGDPQYLLALSTNSQVKSHARLIREI